MKVLPRGVGFGVLLNDFVGVEVGDCFGVWRSREETPWRSSGNGYSAMW